MTIEDSIKSQEDDVNLANKYFEVKDKIDNKHVWDQWEEEQYVM